MNIGYAFEHCGEEYDEKDVHISIPNRYPRSTKLEQFRAKAARIEQKISKRQVESGIFFI